MELLYLIASFAIVIALIWLKINIGVSIFVGSLVLAFLFGMSPGDAVAALYHSATSWETIRLVLIIAFIMGMTSVFSQIGYLKDMETAASNLFPKAKYSLAMLPALIGLMPMPAGALVSAPMIEPVAGKFEMSPTDKTLVNYWFRHVWEHSWPMYQAIVIASALVGISIREMSTKMFPLTILMALIGYVLLIRPLPDAGSGEGDVKTGLRLLLKSTSPILIIILASIVLGLDMVYGAFLGFIAALIPNLRRVDVKKVLAYALQPKIVFLLVAVMYFKYVLQVTGAVETLPNAMISMNLPVVLVLMVTPFIVGLMTGISFAYVGMTFPLLLPFFTSFDMVALAYLSGYMGMLFSPVHLCFVFSAEYYGAELRRVYLRLLPPALLLFAGGVAYIALVL
ncbi:TIGR00529 family membrane protein [Thermococcus sp. 18S1]|uniref:TIGR00529 family membrane protein n=1 Tax=Thermococcus sp. 18S1 TaxID=1638210 RepID=UPI001438F123|nr:TIGR00529 family membrane protein [Thermococcus sp. 18S1]